MPTDTPITDDYVAEILRKDAAKRSRNRFVASGLGSLLGGRSRLRSDAPKPNTRFLKHIVKEADSHNAALKAKEEEESRQRLKDLRRKKDRDVERGRRQADQLLSHLGRKRSEKQPVREERVNGDERKRDDRYDRRRRDRHRSRSRSPVRRKEREYHRDRTSPKPREEKQESRRRRRDSTSEDGFDSDPLADALGPNPAPKVKARGRGAQNNSSMDTRFDPKYDPSTDVGRDLDDEGDDWDMGIEAMRDRAKWRKSGAGRLRAAGFTDAEVENWEKSGGDVSREVDGEKDISDVRWTKKGEDREWDRGKVVEGYHIEQRPEWGRLKGT